MATPASRPPYGRVLGHIRLSPSEIRIGQSGLSLDIYPIGAKLCPGSGSPLYSTQDTPPWVMVGYGPFYPLAYLPAIWAETPVGAVWTATILAHLYILVPVALLCSLFHKSLRDEKEFADPGWASMTCIFILIASQLPSLRYVMTSVHVDAPALGLLLFAYYTTLRATRIGGMRSLWTSLVAGVLLGLSIGCKMNLIPALFALVFTTWWMHGVRHAIACSTAAVISIIVLYVWAINQSQPAAVTLNFKVLGNFPWVTTTQGIDETTNLYGLSNSFGEKMKVTVRLARNFFNDYGVVSLATILFLSLSNAFPKRRGQYCPGSVCLSLLVLALALLPASIASFGKYGGDVNSLALFTLPVTLAALFAAAIGLKQGPKSMRWLATGAHASLILFFTPSIIADLKRSNEREVPIML